MRAFLIAILVLTMAAMLSAQSSEHNVEVGKSVYVKGSKLTIKFIEVVEDSRCPIGVDCFWAGNAKIRVSVAKGKAAPRVIELNTGMEPQTALAYGYELKLTELDPYPVQDKPKTEPSIAKISVKKVR
jgi:hypothetical protein